MGNQKEDPDFGGGGLQMNAVLKGRILPELKVSKSTRTELGVLKKST